MEVCPINANSASVEQSRRPFLLRDLPVPAKILATAVIFTLGFAMLGALGQILVHDIIPTFYDSRMHGDTHRLAVPAEAPAQTRGDLFSDLSTSPGPVEKPAVYRQPQFIWALKWSHIHLFGMNGIFIILGVVTLGLDLTPRARAWLVGLPFVGVGLDIAAVWLKGYVSPAFFWLHLPAGGTFGGIFVFVGLRALPEMWRPGYPHGCR